MDLIQKGIIVDDDVVLPLVPEAHEVVAEAHRARIIWIRICIRPACWRRPSAGHGNKDRGRCRCIGRDDPRDDAGRLASHMNLSS